MTARTFRTRVLLVGSGLAEADLGEKDVTISAILEQGVHTGFYALFDHDGQTVSGTVADIAPPWPVFA
jgi:hypothetical protein